jgi:hypothetical protein
MLELRNKQPAARETRRRIPRPVSHPTFAVTYCWPVQRFPRWLTSLVLACAFGCVFFPGTASALTPQQIFSDYSSGMLKVTSVCPTGTYQGTGFLIGPQVMVTALHVLIDESSGDAPCNVTVAQEGTGQKASVTTYSKWYTVSSTDEDSTDFATAILSSSLAGYYFNLSASSPAAGSSVIGLGYPLGLGLNLAQGTVSARGTSTGGLPLIAMSILQTHGNSGGPLLNASGYVIGLTQTGVQSFPGAGSVTSSTITSLDLARYLNGKPSGLCQGVIATYPSTVCSAQPVAPTIKAYSIQDCWVSQTNSTNPSTKIFQTADALPTIYFVVRLGHKLKKNVTATVTLLQPSGLPGFSAPDTWTWSKLYLSYTTGPITYGSQTQITGGLWTFTATLSDGSSCSYAYNVTR